MKDTFQDLYYKVQVNGKWENHPADKQVDFNSIVDFLEEEHQKRDVFTTAAKEEADENPGATLALVQTQSEQRGPKRRHRQTKEEKEMFLASLKR